MQGVILRSLTNSAQLPAVTETWIRRLVPDEFGWARTEPPCLIPMREPSMDQIMHAHPYAQITPLWLVYVDTHVDSL